MSLNPARNSTGLWDHNGEILVEDLIFRGNHQFENLYSATGYVRPQVGARMNVYLKGSEFAIFQSEAPYEPGEDGREVAAAKLWLKVLEWICR